MKATTNFNRPVIYMALLLAVTFALRIWGIWFGLPFSYHPDEYHEVFRALELGSGGFNLDRTGKGGYFYLLFVEYGFLFVVLKLAGIVESAQDFARYYFRDPSNFYMIGRATTALIGTLNVYLVYRLTTRSYATGAGILAAIFIAFDFLNTQHSHYVTVDVPMTCLATAALLFAVRMVTGGRRKDYLAAALFAALATTTKIPAVLLLIPLIIAHFYHVRQQAVGSRNFFLNRDLWSAAGIFVVVLAITNPGLFINLSVWQMFSGAEGATLEATEKEFEEMLGVRPNLFVYYWDGFVDSMGWPLLILSVAGSLYALWKRTPTDVMLVSFAAVWYVVFCMADSHLYYPRYMLPVIVVLTILAGRVLYDAWLRIERRIVAKHSVAVVAIVTLVISPVYATIQNNILLTRDDTRTVAKEWFEENVPAGSKVLIEGLTIEPTRQTVPLHNSADNLRKIREHYKSVGDRGKVTYLDFMLQVIPELTYDLELMKHAELESLEYYREIGVQYMVIRPDPLEHSRKSGAEAIAFLDALRTDPDVSPIKRFRFDPSSRNGPDIDVYRIDSNAVVSSTSAIPTP